MNNFALKYKKKNALELEQAKISQTNKNEILIKIVEIIMEYAPIGVFALLAGLIVDLAGDDPNNIIITLKPLLIYAITVLVGLATMIFLFYPSILYFITKIGYKNFFKAIFPAQMLAFSTSSFSTSTKLPSSHIPASTEPFGKPKIPLP